MRLNAAQYTASLPRYGIISVLRWPANTHFSCLHPCRPQAGVALSLGAVSISRTGQSHLNRPSRPVADESYIHPVAGPVLLEASQQRIRICDLLLVYRYEHVA